MPRPFRTKLALRNFLLLLVLLQWSTAFTATIDTVSIYSAAMGKASRCVVIKPAGYVDNDSRYPVVYLLHGYGGDFGNWLSYAPGIKALADDFELLIVCPDGASDGWYLDSPVEPFMKYETYIAKEVPAFIDKHYRTINDRGARAITGLSMGGHGALLIGFRHAGFFGACGSMSGVLDLRPFKTSYQLQARIGDTIANADNWNRLTVVNIIGDSRTDSSAIIIDCGISDPFLRVNRDVHEKMLRLRIPHEYIERPGGHGWPYWNNAVKFQLYFFRDHFNRQTFVKKKS